MGVTRRSLFKKIAWQIEAFFYFFFRKCLGFFPLKTAYAVGCGLGLVAYYLSARYRLIVRKNLLLAFGEHLRGEELQALLKKTFVQNGGNLLSALCAESKSIEELFSRVELEGLSQFEELLKREKGVIVVLGHMGNWEILARFKGFLKDNRRLAMIYRPLSNERVNDMMLKQRAKGGMEMLSYRNSGLRIIRLLKKGGIFCIMSDQRIGKAGERADFMGRTVLCTKFPTVLHRQTGAPVVTASMQTLEGLRWKLVVKEVPLGEPSTHHQATMTALGEALSASPADVFWFQDRWKLVQPIFHPSAHRRPLHVLFERSASPEAQILLSRFSQRSESIQVTFWESGWQTSEIHAAEEQQGIAFDVAIGFHAPSPVQKEARRAGVGLFLGFGDARELPGAWKGVSHHKSWSFERLLASLGL